MPENKMHYKMYKLGKLWLYAGISTLVLASGGLLSGGPVSADEASTNS
ncbi:hypothetical protein JOC36_000528 [Weissella uvarum]|nr:KxYKxGKxW signal peptide domain-containing protein [Weissella uvarum]MBM7616979.1 hypothetical protein [Weissella uvarum]MCM0595280.1 KxYKxGKxW signal peptide domain-containing protein [Weissella uvarum]